MRYGRNRHGRAVVLGGSVAGLVAARVLAGGYDEVVVVERDHLPEGAEHRRGVAQGRHVHALLAGGQQALEQLFAGLTAELTALGAPVGDMLGDVHAHLGGYALRRGRSDLLAVHVSRPALEASLRARVRALPNATLMDRCDGAGLTTTADATAVTGVRVIRRADGSAEETLAADLVVDATGRHSRAPAALEALGYGHPPVERIGIGVGYATRTYRLGPNALGGDLGILVGATPQHPRGGALATVEGGRCLVTLFGVLGDHPPTDVAGFEEFASTLQCPEVYEAVRDAEPLDEPVAFRHPASVRHRYERLRRFPDGLLVVGDAVSTFNPIYGQGMSVVALQGLALRRHLAEPGCPRPLEFMREVGRIVDVPWGMAAGGDLSFPGAEGPRTIGMRVLGEYVTRLQAGAAHDARLGRAFLRVAGLVDPPMALLRPDVVARALRPRRPRDGVVLGAVTRTSSAPGRPGAAGHRP
jgi:2-polyprenyl-6-methoxyphenol hydroxylase-like FAD-dependent oxidoreductase